MLDLGGKLYIALNTNRSSYMNIIKDIDQLNQIYDKPVERSLKKVASVITPLYQRWIEESRFLVIATVGIEGCDCSPRGDLANLVKIPNENTIWLPDWKGNNRLDSLKNIVRDERISLMFMINGCNNVVRINGSAVISTEDRIRKAFQRKANEPKTVIVVGVKEVYFQCAKALMRSDLWKTENAPVNLPTAGEFSKEQDTRFDAVAYDNGYEQYAKARLW